MTPITALYAFTNPDIDSLELFVKFINRNLPADIDIKIGVSSDAVVPELGGIQVFPERTTVSAMLNQLAAASENPVLLFNDGAILPRLRTRAWQKLQSLEPGACVTIDGRRPITLPFASEPEFDHLIWDEVEFNRSVHEESPLSYAVRREDFLHIRGFDERPAYENCRTMDLVARLRRSRVTRRTIDRAASFAFDTHGAFPGITEEKIPLMVSMRENQKSHVQSDSSIYRNLEQWSVPSEQRQLLVSVSIATRNRAAYLTDSINSVLAQTFEDFELIVVDDGSDDDTESVVRSFADPRVRYLKQEAKGISSARNRAADNSRGYFTAVHDDDDIMLPWRLATSLRTITAEHRASYGSWVNFDDVTAELVLHITKHGFGRDLVAYSGQTPGHATWLLPTSIIQSIRYDETLTSSVDHNLAVRSVMSGLTWKHSEKVLFLRRLHPSQVSQTDARRQRAAAVLTRFTNGFSAEFNSTKTMVERGKSLTFPAPADKAKLFEAFGAYLPDHLVQREVLIQGLVGKKVLALDLHDRFDFIAAETDLITDRSTLELGGAGDVTWQDIVLLRQRGIVGCRFIARRRGLSPRDEDTTSSPAVDMIVQDRQARELRTISGKHPAAVLLKLDIDHVDSDVIGSAPGLISAKHFSINYGDYERRRFVLLGFRNQSFATRFATSEIEQVDSKLMIVPATRDFAEIAQHHLRTV